MKSFAIKNRSKMKVLQLHLISIYFSQKLSLSQFDQTCHEIFFLTCLSVLFTAMNLWTCGWESVCNRGPAVDILNLRTELWAPCSTSLLLNFGRSLKSLLAETKRCIRLATNYFFTRIRLFLLLKLHPMLEINWGLPIMFRAIDISMETLKR